MPPRKQALLLALGASGVVLVATGFVLEGVVLLSVALEVYVLCLAFLNPIAAPGKAADDDEDDGPDGWDPPDFPPDPWPPMDPGARGTDERTPTLV